jgi:hypothetical protein
MNRSFEHKFQSYYYECILSIWGIINVGTILCITGILYSSPALKISQIIRVTIYCHGIAIIITLTVLMLCTIINIISDFHFNGCMFVFGVIYILLDVIASLIYLVHFDTTSFNIILLIYSTSALLCNICAIIVTILIIKSYINRRQSYPSNTQYETNNTISINDTKMFDNVSYVHNNQSGNGNNLIKKEYGIRMDAQLMCTICHDDYTKHTQTLILECGHIFHIKCIDNWVIVKQSCPLCQRVIINK